MGAARAGAAQGVGEKIEQVILLARPQCRVIFLPGKQKADLKATGLNERILRGTKNRIAYFSTIVFIYY